MLIDWVCVKVVGEILTLLGASICLFFCPAALGESPFEEITEQIAVLYEGQLKLLKLINQQAILVNDDNYTVENSQWRAWIFYRAF
ncbi:hypothetical protein [Streptococcus ferus]|uniref:hypothetical protein n=1 Tax=Streptococcus ferus TaxID=1345 RepID=UPI0035A10B84